MGQFIWIFYQFLAPAKKALKEKSRKLQVTNELFKALNQNKHYPICRFYPLLLTSLEFFDTFSVKWTINPYSLRGYVHFVVKLSHKLYKEEIFIWRREWHFIKKINVSHFKHWSRKIAVSKTDTFSWYRYKSKVIFSNNIVISEIVFENSVSSFLLLLSHSIWFQSTYNTYIHYLYPVQYLHPLKRNPTGAIASISRLALKMMQV